MEYFIEIERNISVEREDVVAKDINTLRKNLIKRFTPKRGWAEYTIVISRYTSPNSVRYVGTMYLYFGEEGYKGYTWAINPKNNWGNYRHVLSKSIRYDLSPTTGKLIRKK